LKLGSWKPNVGDSVVKVGFSGCGCGMEVLVVGVGFVEEGMR